MESSLFFTEGAFCLGFSGQRGPGLAGLRYLVKFQEDIKGRLDVGSVIGATRMTQAEELSQ